MTPRSFRRAAERKTLKAARKAASHPQPNTPSEPAAATTTAPEAAAMAHILANPRRPDAPPSPLVAAFRAERAAFRAAEDHKSSPRDQVSAARLSANLANAQMSTGPRSSEGKAAVSLNALKSGLTGITVILCEEEKAAYERHLNGYQDEFQPQTARERALVQSIADSAWRILRIAHLEMSYHAARPRPLLR